MSDHQPPPPPGPYGQQPPPQPPVPPGPQGQQPPQPGPFGAPPPQPPPSAQPPVPPQAPPPGGQPGAPGYGHPQQPPPGPGVPYGQPQPQPPGPYPGPPGAPYGGPVPPPPPPGGGGKGKVIGIVVAVVLVLGLAGGGIYAVTQGDDKGDDQGNQQADNGGGQGGGDDGGKYQLTMPETLLDGQYEKAEGGELDTSDAEATEVLDALRISNATAQRGLYFNGPPGLPQYSDSPDNKTLVLLGAHGEVADPQAALEGAFTFMSEEAMSETAEKVGEPETVQLDDGSGAAMKCQVTESENSGGQPYQRGWCVWADQSTVGMAQYADTTTPDSTVGMDVLTELVSDVRDEIRVER